MKYTILQTHKMLSECEFLYYNDVNYTIYDVTDLITSEDGLYKSDVLLVTPSGLTKSIDINEIDLSDPKVMLLKKVLVNGDVEYDLDKFSKEVFDRLDMIVSLTEE